MYFKNILILFVMQISLERVLKIQREKNNNFSIREFKFLENDNENVNNREIMSHLKSCFRFQSQQKSLKIFVKFCSEKMRV